MSFNIFAKEVTGSADEVNDNFEHIASGDRLPMTGNSLTSSVAGTFDLGEQDTRWKGAYVNNIDMTGEMTKAWNLIAETTLDSATNRIEFAGLDGDTDEVYMVNSNIKCPIGTNTNFRMYFNADSVSSYSTQYIIANSTTISGGRQNSPIELGVNFGTNATQYLQAEVITYAKSGHERTSLSTNTRRAEGTYIYRLCMWGNVWDNTADNITTIQITADSTSTALGVGTNVQLWAKR